MLSATYKAHLYNVTPHTYISSGATKITVSPEYGVCTLLDKPATFVMNGCDYVFDLEGTTGADKFGLKTTIICPKEKHIQIAMLETEADHTKGKSFCALTITEKTEGYAGLGATDTTNGGLDIAGTVKGITVDREGEGALCGTAETKTAEIHLDIQLSGINSSKESRGVSISDSGQFEWDEASYLPNSLTGPLGYVFRCPNTSYTGHRANVTPHEGVPTNATEVTITPKYINCNQQVDAIGCDYVLRDATTTGGIAGTYGMLLDLICPVGKDIEVTNAPCSGGAFHVPQQTGLTGLHLSHTIGAEDDTDLTGTANITINCSGVGLTGITHAELTIKGQNPTTKANTPVTVTD